jgi:hypothetical protein
MLEELANIGEVFGGIASLLALGYLAIQIRQANLLARAHARQTLIDTFAQINTEVARDPSLARAIAAGLRYWPHITNEQKTCFDLNMGRYLMNLNNGLLLVEAGMLDQHVFDEIAENMVMCLPMPGGAAWWKETGMATPRVRKYLDLRVEGAAATPGFDSAVPWWYALADAETRSAN